MKEKPHHKPKVISDGSPDGDANACIAEALQKRRIELGLTLEKVHELTGMSKSTIARHERGETSPSIVEFVKYAVIYGFDSIWEIIPLSLRQRYEKAFEVLGAKFKRPDYGQDDEIENDCDEIENLINEILTGLRTQTFAPQQLSGIIFILRGVKEMMKPVIK